MRQVRHQDPLLQLVVRLGRLRLVRQSGALHAELEADPGLRQLRQAVPLVRLIVLLERVGLLHRPGRLRGGQHHQRRLRRVQHQKVYLLMQLADLLQHLHLLGQQVCLRPVLPLGLPPGEQVLLLQLRQLFVLLP